tara:strand:- start:211 stop:792 length:582 start_codon:yes stop_codon:yes gene_type:complete
MKPHKVIGDYYVYTHFYPHWKEKNPILKQKILEIKSNNPNTIDTQPDNTSWHSSYSLHVEYNDFNSIVKFAEQASKHIARTHYYTEANFDVYNLWAMTYDVGQDTKLHHHFPSCLSAVYFVDVEENAAPLCFLDQELKPQNGLLAVFPSNLGHHVPPTNGSRVIMSMNLEADLKEKSNMIRGDLNFHPRPLTY